MKLNPLNFRELELRDFQGGKTMKKKALNFNTRKNAIIIVVEQRKMYLLFAVYVEYILRNQI